MKSLRPLLMLAVALLVTQFAHAHRFAPSLLKVSKIGPDRYHCV